MRLERRTAARRELCHPSGPGRLCIPPASRRLGTCARSAPEPQDFVLSSASVLMMSNRAAWAAAHCEIARSRRGAISWQLPDSATLTKWRQLSGWQGGFHDDTARTQRAARRSEAGTVVASADTRESIRGHASLPKATESNLRHDRSAIAHFAGKRRRFLRSRVTAVAVRFRSARCRRSICPDGDDGTADHETKRWEVGAFVRAPRDRNSSCRFRSEYHGRRLRLRRHGQGHLRCVRIRRCWRFQRHRLRRSCAPG